MAERVRPGHWPNLFVSARRPQIKYQAMPFCPDEQMPNHKRKIFNFDALNFVTPSSALH
jgi:hypothetical protein